MATTIEQLSKAFQKIYANLTPLEDFEKELMQIYPSPTSEIFLGGDYDNDDNSIGISIYVSNPLPLEEVKPMNFDKLMFEYLIRATQEHITDISECIELMERKEGIRYQVDFIPVFYTEELGDYDIHFRITKIKARRNERSKKRKMQEV